MSTQPNPELSNTPAAQPSSGLRWLLYAGLFMLVGMMILIYIGRDQSTIVNAPMPVLDLVPISMTQEKLTNESLQGQVVVYHFWGTWCPPCRVEYPEFYAVYQKFQDNPKVKFVSVSCDDTLGNNLPELTKRTEEYLQQIKAEMPIYADPAVFTRTQITRMLSAGGFAYPSTLLVDQNGIVRYLWRGASPTGMTDLNKKIDQLLASPPQPKT